MLQGRKECLKACPDKKTSIAEGLRRHTVLRFFHFCCAGPGPLPLNVADTAGAGAVLDPTEPVYCYCRRVSFGEMVACDNPDCPVEWFHFGCVGITQHPKGKWYCRDCEELRKAGKLAESS